MFKFRSSLVEIVIENIMFRVVVRGNWFLENYGDGW